jgi:Fe2+ or Zn2+ uptake regulation protein
LRKSEISRKILSYLERHPDAQDTLQGIMEWWLSERVIRYQMATVKEALDELVNTGLVLEVKGGDGSTRYRVNRQKLKEKQPMVKPE